MTQVGAILLKMVLGLEINVRDTKKMVPAFTQQVDYVSRPVRPNDLMTQTALCFPSQS